MLRFGRSDRERVSHELFITCETHGDLEGGLAVAENTRLATEEREHLPLQILLTALQRHPRVLDHLLLYGDALTEEGRLGRLRVSGRPLGDLEEEGFARQEQRAQIELDADEVDSPENIAAQRDLRLA